MLNVLQQIFDWKAQEGAKAVFPASLQGDLATPFFLDVAVEARVAVDQRILTIDLIPRGGL